MNKISKSLDKYSFKKDTLERFYLYTPFYVQTIFIFLQVCKVKNTLKSTVLPIFGCTIQYLASYIYCG